MSTKMIDYGPWMRPEALADQLGGQDALDSAIRAHEAETYTVEGLNIARRIRCKSIKSSNRWMSYPEASRLLGIGERAVQYRVERGEITRRIRKKAGRYIYEVKICQEETGKPPDTVESHPQM